MKYNSAVEMCKAFGFDETILENETMPINPAYLQNILLNKINTLKLTNKN